MLQAWSRLGFVRSFDSILSTLSGSNDNASLARSDKSVRSFTIQPSVSKVSRVKHFVGREENITEVCEALQYNSSRKTAVVQGLGGIGKTQLALAYAQRHKDDYSAVF